MRFSNVRNRLIKLIIVLCAVFIAVVFCAMKINTGNASFGAVAFADSTQLSITVNDKTVDYNGEAQSISGEDIFVIYDTQNITNYMVTYKNETYQESQIPPINAGIYTVTVSVPESNNYAAASKSATLTVNRIEPEIVFSGVFEQQYGSFTAVSARAVGKYNDLDEVLEVLYNFDVNGTVYCGDYKAEAAFAGNTNYLPKSVSQDIKITEREINIMISGSYDYVYSGFKQERIVSRSGILQADVDNFVLTVLYNGESAAIDAGVYKLTFSINNPNYIIGTVTGDPEMKILQKVLTVKPLDAVTDYGAMPVFTYSYSGFAANDTVSVIEKLPVVSNVPVEPGVYEFVPSGAQAKNYSFNYLAGKLTVNKTTVSGETDSGITFNIKGSFSPSAELSFNSVDKKDESLAAFISALKNHRQISGANNFIAVYDLSLQEGTISGEYVEITVRGLNLPKMFTKRIAVMGRDGSLQKIEKYTYKDGVLTFKTPIIGQIAVYKITAPAYIAIGVVSLIVLIVAVYFITSAVVFKRRKKYGSKAERDSLVELPGRNSDSDEPPKHYKW